MRKSLVLILDPYRPLNDLLLFCKSNNINVISSSPFGGSSATLAYDDTVLQIASETRTTPAQVLIAWGIKRETCVIPRSSRPEHVEANAQICDLTEEQFRQLNLLACIEKTHLLHV